MKQFFLFIMIICLLGGCTKSVYTTADGDRTTSVVIGTSNRGKADKVTPVRIGNQNYIPKATAFRMSGDYSDNVAISMNLDGTLTYFPAPSDVSAASAPIDLGDGWWLNRQGFGLNSVFTNYTFSQYHDLTSVPSPEQLKESVIPGAYVTRIVELPYSIGEAQSHIPEIKEYLKNL